MGLPFTFVSPKSGCPKTILNTADPGNRELENWGSVVKAMQHDLDQKFSHYLFLLLPHALQSGNINEGYAYM